MHSCGEAEQHSHLRKQSGSPYKVKHIFPINAVIPLLEKRPREMKSYEHLTTCARAFIVLLFIIVPTGNNPNVLPGPTG